MDYCRWFVSQKVQSFSIGQKNLATKEQPGSGTFPRWCIFLAGMKWNSFPDRSKIFSYCASKNTKPVIFCRSWESLKLVRKTHVCASNSSSNKGLGVIDRVSMTLTIFGFMGYALVRPHLLGIRHDNIDDRKGFVHFWAVIGSMLGIKDSNNMCLHPIEVVETWDLHKMRSSHIFEGFSTESVKFSSATSLFLYCNLKRRFLKSLVKLSQMDCENICRSQPSDLVCSLPGVWQEFPAINSTLTCPKSSSFARFLPQLSWNVLGKALV